MAIVQVLIPYHLVTAGATVAALGGEGNRTDIQEHAIVSQAEAE